MAQPFARLVIDLGDANDNGKADLSATLKIGPFTLPSLPPIDVDFLNGLGFIKSTFGKIRELVPDQPSAKILPFTPKGA